MDVNLTQSGKSEALNETSRLLRNYFANPSSHELIRRSFERVSGLTSKKAIEAERILVGEFGGGFGPEVFLAVKNDRLTWFRAVTVTAEAFRFSWCYWS